MSGLTAGILCLAASVNAEPIEFRYGIDVLSNDQSSVDAFQSIAALREIRPNLYFGQSLYSAAAGDAGGLFIGGFELLKRWQLGERTALEFGGFIGGGGGGSIVPGDGLMTRAHITLLQSLGRGYAATAGLSYIDISGSPISTPAFSFGLTREVDFAFLGGHNTPRSLKKGRILRAVKPIFKQFDPSSSTQRSGTPLGTMSLLGFEASFASSPQSQWETFIQSTGAVSGDGEGYADIQAGLRWRTSPTGWNFFGETAVGFGGGGDVDTGGGLIASVGAGVGVPLFPGVGIEVGAQATAALGGDFTALSPFLRASLSFGDKSNPTSERTDPRRWQLSLGLTSQIAHSGLRKPGNTKTDSLTLTESAIDLFISERTYLTGNAQTIVDGGAGGYAVGLLGIGYAMPINDRWTVSIEGHLGAAGGGGIDTGGGLIGGGRVEIDYAINESVAISGGVGMITSLRDGGAEPVTLHIGLKTAFTTFH